MVSGMKCLGHEDQVVSKDLASARGKMWQISEQLKIT